MLNTHSLRPESNSQIADIQRIVAAREGQNWCLFVDRDGVINRRIHDGYVRTWSEFDWLPNAEKALRLLRKWAPHLVVVTNQQGIGKGLMTTEEVATIHNYLQNAISPLGDAIEAFQVCPHLSSECCECRKPEPGLVLDWLSSRPLVAPALSIVVGDSQSDHQLALNVAAAAGGCASISIGNSSLEEHADASFDSLWEFAAAVDECRRTTQL